MPDQTNENRKNRSYSDDFVSLFGTDGGSNKPKDKNDNITNVNPSNLRTTFGSLQDHHDMPNNDITPNILLEQLAYVDNFLPSLERDFNNLDSWMMGDDNATTNNGHMNPSQLNAVTSYNNIDSFNLDDQLAAELSAFADESFIFPDEDKPAKDDEDDKKDEEKNEDEKRKSHFLTQRRNNFLTSQYDQSKSRFSSKNKIKNQHNEDNNDNEEQIPTDDHQITSFTPSPQNHDHGGFTNFDVITAPLTEAERTTSNSMLPPQQHVPIMPSPLNNTINNYQTTIQNNQWAPTHQQMPIHQSQSMSSISSTIHSSSTTSANPSNSTISWQPNRHQQQKQTPILSNIQMPDYSNIPTSTLISLLPRVKVPPGAYHSLIRAGFQPDQIDAISAIIAYNEQQKSHAALTNPNNNNNNNLNINDQLRTESGADVCLLYTSRCV